MQWRSYARVEIGAIYIVYMQDKNHKQWYIEVEYLRPYHIYSYVTKVFHVYVVTLSYAVEVCWSKNIMINNIILTKHSVFSNMIFSFNYMSFSSWYDRCRKSLPIPVAHFNRDIFYWSTCTKPEKWTVMSLYVRGNDVSSFWDFDLIFEFLNFSECYFVFVFHYITCVV